MRLDWQACKLQPGLLHILEAASPGSRVKRRLIGSLSHTDVLRSNVVQQKDHFPAKCFILGSMKLEGQYNTDKCPLTMSSVHKCAKSEMFPVILKVYLLGKPS